MYKLTKFIKKKEIDFFGSILARLLLFLASFFLRRKYSELQEVTKSRRTINQAQIPDPPFCVGGSEDQ